MVPASDAKDGKYQVNTNEVGSENNKGRRTIYCVEMTRHFRVTPVLGFKLYGKYISTLFRCNVTRGCRRHNRLETM